MSFAVSSLEGLRMDSFCVIERVRSEKDALRDGNWDLASIGSGFGKFA